MTLDNIIKTKVITPYGVWLSEQFKHEQLDETNFVITTPFLDHSNDCIQIFGRLSIDGTVRFSDGGETAASAMWDQFTCSTVTTNNIVNTTLNGFGVYQDKSEFIVMCRMDNFHQKFHNLLQCIIALDSIFLGLIQKD